MRDNQFAIYGDRFSVALFSLYREEKRFLWLKELSRLAVTEDCINAAQPPPCSYTMLIFYRSELVRLSP